MVILIAIYQNKLNNKQTQTSKRKLKYFLLINVSVSQLWTIAHPCIKSRVLEDAVNIFSIICKMPSSGNVEVWKSAGAITPLITVIVLALCCLVSFASRLFAVIRFESIIHEFDPWFNYRATHYLSKNGFYNFLNWFDETAWYPLGRIVGGTVSIGLTYFQMHA